MSGKNIISDVVSAVRNFCTMGTEEEKIEKVGELQGEKFSADSCLWRARKGKFNSYKVYLDSGEKVIFNIWSCVHRDSGRLLIQVFPVSYYKDGKLVMRVTRVKEGKQPFLSGGVLFDYFHVERIPKKYRAELEQWALLIMEGVRRYDKKTHEFNLARQ